MTPKSTAVQKGNLIYSDGYREITIQYAESRRYKL